MWIEKSNNSSEERVAFGYQGNNLFVRVPSFLVNTFFFSLGKQVEKPLNYFSS